MAHRPTDHLSTPTPAGNALAEALRDARSALDVLRVLDLHSLHVDELAAGLVDLQKVVDKGTAVLARFVSAADDALVWAGSGNKNIIGWLADHSKIGYSRAADLTKLADTLDANSTIARKVHNGEMTTATATALAPSVLAPPPGASRDDVDQLIECCSAADPKEARAAAEFWRTMHDSTDEVELARRRFARRALRFAHPSDGMVAISGQLPTLQADQVSKALTACGGGRPQPGDTRTPEQRMADGLLALTRHAAGTPNAARAPGAPPPADEATGEGMDGGAAVRPPGGRQGTQLLVTVSADTISGASNAPGVTEYGHVLPAAVVRGLAATARRSDVIPLVHDGAKVLAVGPCTELDLGRRARLASRAQYLALVARDGHCRWPGCRVPASWCHVEHVVPWSSGGTTDLRELWLICSAHHTEKHRPGTRCSTGPDGTHGTVTIELPNGTVLTSSPAGPIMWVAADAVHPAPSDGGRAMVGVRASAAPRTGRASARARAPSGHR